MKMKLGIMSVALALAACDSGSQSMAATEPAATVPAAMAPAATAPAASLPAAIAPVAAPADAVEGDPFPASYTLPSGEVLTAANVQNPPPADGKLAAMAGVHMTLTDNPDQTKLAVFQWDEKNVGPTQRRVILTQDTVVDFNGKLGTINDIDPATARGAVVASISKGGVYAVMLRFGHGLLQASADQLTPKQVAALESIAPVPSAASNKSFEQKAASLGASLQLGDAAKERAVAQAILKQQEAVRDAHNAGFGPAAAVRVEFNRAMAELLTPEQVDTVKDAMTGNKTPTTFKVYHQIVTDLNADDDKVIMSLLKEAREGSLDVKNLEEMAPIYKKYKDQIEAYINAHGHDYKALYKTFVDGQKATGNPTQ